MKSRIPLLLFFVLAFHFSFAQIQHFTNIQNGDIDGDGVQDFVIKIDGHWQDMGDSRQRITEASITLKNGFEVIDSSHYVDVFKFKDSIAVSNEWNTGLKSLFTNYSMCQCFYPEDWNNPKYCFLGIRQKRQEDYYYGWLRINNSLDAPVVEAVLHENPNTTIQMGEGINSIKPLLPSCTDEFNNGNFGDLEVKFYSPFYSSFIKEYRLFALKDNSTKDYTSEELLDFPEIKYTVVQSFSGVTKLKLSALMNDVDGDPMNFSNDYRICVLAVSNDTYLFKHSYGISPKVTINTVLPETNAPSSTDISDLGTSSDLKVEFVQNPRQDMTEEYRLLIVPSDSVKNFTLEKAESINSYFSIKPGHDSVYTVQNQFLKDVFGEEIEHNTFYNSFILSIPDKIYSNVSSLSEASNLFCLGIPSYFKAGQKIGKEVKFEDPNPDLIANPLQFDFDNDSIIDLTFTYKGDWRPSLLIEHYFVETGKNIEIICEDNSAINLLENTPLNKLHNWKSGKIDLAYSYWPGYAERKKRGQFFWDGTLGFRKVSGKDTVCGWVNLYLVYDIAIKEYAIQSNSMRLFPDSISTDFIAYPNPNTDRTINFAIADFDENKNYFVDILNASAGIIRSIKVTKQLTQINASNLPKGMIYIRLRTKDKQETQKIILQ